MSMMMMEPSAMAFLERLEPDAFANGGDRKKDVPEMDVCERLGIEMLWNVGRGGKIQSSSELVAKSRKSKCQCLKNVEKDLNERQRKNTGKS